MMYNNLSALNINLSENKIELFNKFIKEFCAYSEKINLISQWSVIFIETIKQK